jgi:hypothetical protein
VLGVEAPPFAAGRNKSEGAQLPEGGKILVFNLLSNIEVMTWYGLMINNTS